MFLLEKKNLLILIQPKLRLSVQLRIRLLKSLQFLYFPSISACRNQVRPFFHKNSNYLNIFANVNTCTIPALNEIHCTVLTCNRLKSFLKILSENLFLISISLLCNLFSLLLYIVSFVHLILKWTAIEEVTRLTVHWIHRRNKFWYSCKKKRERKTFTICP